MQFESGHLYHIFNQGNNKQPIFLEDKNYIYFINKMRQHLLPHCNILAWCLMPNHFHWMVEVINTEVSLSTSNEPYASFNNQHSLREYSYSKNETIRTLNQSIGILLRSYTRAFNKMYNRSGSLFREGTKAHCLSRIDILQPPYFFTQSGSVMNISFPEKEYPQVCFEYVHNNPTAAGLVNMPEAWKYSSLVDYQGIRNGTLINKARAKLYVEW